MPKPVETDAAAPNDADGLPTPRRYWSILVIWLAIGMAVLDGAIANVALPTIAHELHATPAASIWIVNAYQLAITVALLPLAALGDRLGYRHVYMAGLAIFTLGSAGCALSHSLVALTTARVFQGLGAAGIMSINGALVRFTYPRRLLGRGIGFNAVVISISSAIGPSIAAAILGVAKWEWLFAINIPVGVTAIVIASRALPVTIGSKAKFDWLSAILNVLAFGFIIVGAESIARDGLGAGFVKLAIGLVAGVLLALRELPRAAPLVPLDLLKIPIFGLSAATSVVSFAAQMTAYVALPFYFQVEMGHSAVEAGLLMTPWPLAVAITAPIAGHLADRHSVGLLGAIGLGVFAIGLFAVSQIPLTASYLDIVWRMALCGLGFGFFQSPNNRAMVASAPLHRSGAAGGMLATARLLGQTAGAVTTAVFFELAGTRASTSALVFASALAALAAMVSLTRLRMAPDAGVARGRQRAAPSDG